MATDSARAPHGTVISVSVLQKLPLGAKTRFRQRLAVILRLTWMSEFNGGVGVSGDFEVDGRFKRKQPFGVSKGLLNDWADRFAEGALYGPHYSSVTQPSLALFTFLMYL